MRRQAAATLLWLLTYLADASAAAMLDLPRAESVPGGIVILNLHREEKPLYAVWRKRRVMLVQRRGRWFAVLGIPLSLPPGRYELIVRYGNRSMRPVPFIIRAKHYRTQHISIANQRMVTGIADHQFGVTHGLPEAGGQVVEYHDGFAALAQLTYDVTADVTGAAGHENRLIAHEGVLWFSIRVGLFASGGAWPPLCVRV